MSRSSSLLRSFIDDGGDNDCRDIEDGGAVTVTRRNWARLDVDAFRKDLLESNIFTNPPVNCDDLFSCYDCCLRETIDKHVPIETKVKRGRQSEPWFNMDCRQMKKETRRLEKIYRATHTAVDERAWRQQFDLQRSVFQQAYANYWKSVIDKCPDSRSLWRTVGVLLEPELHSVSVHSASAFSTFSPCKVDSIRATTALAPTPR